MSDINYAALILMVVINCGLILITYRKIPQNTSQVYYLFSIISIFIFSGFGISYNEIGQEFLVEYIIFSSVFTITFYIAIRSTKKKNKKSFISDKFINSIKIDITNDKRKNNNFYVICTVLFYLTFFIFLVVPEVRISQLWNPPNSTVIGGYERINLTQNNVILDIATMFRTLLLPFFMVYLYDLKNRGKNSKIFLLVMLWIYLYFLSQIYISRYEMIVLLVFLFVLITSKKNNGFRISKNQLIIIAFVFVLSIPALLSYQYSRSGFALQNLTFGQACSELMGIELQFPRFYPSTVALSDKVSLIKYILWFILLPIPSFLLPSKGDITILINRVFSSYILGLDYGNAGYYGLLPSILGEAILIYNQYFFWIHAIFLAIMLAKLCKILEKIPELGVLNLYFAINVFTIPRGGTQGYFGMVINSLVFYIFFRWIVIGYKKRKKRRL